MQTLTCGFGQATCMHVHGRGRVFVHQHGVAVFGYEYIVGWAFRVAAIGILDSMRVKMRIAFPA